MIADSQLVRSAVEYPVAATPALRGTVASAVEGSEGDRVGETALPLPAGGEPRWVAVFSTDLGDVDDNVALIRRQILIAGMIALLAALGAGWVVAGVHARRLRRLERAAVKVADGDFSDPIPVDSNDEVGQLAITFNEMQKRLAVLDSARKEFIANASHELRTPIFSLAGFVELLADEDPDPEARAEFVGEMRGQIERLTKLTVDLLDLSKLDADAIQIRRERVDLADGRPQGGRRVRADRRPPRLGDHDRAGARRAPPAPTRRGCAQIMRILIDNALTHTPEGTAIKVGTKSAADNGSRERPGHRRRPGHRPARPRADLRALLHRRRGLRLRPRAGDRPRAGAADGRLADAQRPQRAHRVRARAAARPRELGSRGALAALGAPLVAAAALAAGCGSNGNETTTVTAASSTTTAEDDGSQRVVIEAEDGAFDASAIYEAVSPGVVTVISVFGDTGPAVFGGGGGGGGQGSGFVISDDGEILTNAHVVTDAATTGSPTRPLHEATETFIQFADRNQVEAEIVGFDPFADVALLKVDPEGLDLQPLPLGSETDVAVGDDGGGDRQPVRAEPVALGRGRLRGPTARSSR